MRIVWRATRDIPDLGLVSGDVLCADSADPEPVVVSRALPLNWGAFLAAEMDGALERASLTLSGPPSSWRRRRARLRIAAASLVPLAAGLLRLHR